MKYLLIVLIFISCHSKVEKPGNPIYGDTVNGAVYWRDRGITVLHDSIYPLQMIQFDSTTSAGIYIDSIYAETPILHKTDTVFIHDTIYLR